MGDRQVPTFAQQVDAYANRKQLNNYKLSLAIGLLPSGHGYSAKQVERLRDGRAVPSRAMPGLVTRLIQVFDLTDEEAADFWYAAGMIPDDWTAADFAEAMAGHRRRQRHDRSRRRGDRELPSTDANPDRLRPVGRFPLAS
jgi:hypothetical protein